MSAERQSLRAIGDTNRARRHLNLRAELTLAVLPTVTILIVLGVVEVLGRQRLLFASLALSAFLIYLDPMHGANSTRTLIVSQMTAALLGFGAYAVFGPSYAAAALAMIGTVVLMIRLDTVHPPAVSTALAFAFRAGPQSSLFWFALAVGIIVILVALQRLTLWLLARHMRRVSGAGFVE